MPTSLGTSGRNFIGSGETEDGMTCWVLRGGKGEGEDSIGDASGAKVVRRGEVLAVDRVTGVLKLRLAIAVAGIASLGRTPGVGRPLPTASGLGSMTTDTLLLEETPPAGLLDTLRRFLALPSSSGTLSKPEEVDRTELPLDSLLDRLGWDSSTTGSTSFASAGSSTVKIALFSAAFRARTSGGVATIRGRSKPKDCVTTR